MNSRQLLICSLLQFSPADNLLIARLPCGTQRGLLPLLPSGPDGVCNLLLRRTRLSTRLNDCGRRTDSVFTEEGVLVRFALYTLRRRALLTPPPSGRLIPHPGIYLAPYVVHALWRRAPCKVRGCHEPSVVRGGERGIRTLDPVISGIHDFQSCPFGLSGISPFIRTLCA